MDNNFKTKIKQYGLLTAAITGAGEGNASIVYTDVDPDFAGGVGGQYMLDLNNDGINDFRIFHNNGNILFFEPLNAGNEFLGSGSTSYYAYPYALNNAALIGNSAFGSWLDNGYTYGYATLNFGTSGVIGNWVNVSNKFLGLKILVGGQEYFGWARLDVNLNGSSWIVKDYAYEDTPNTSINAGATGLVPADGVSSIMASDTSNHGNGTDLEVSFNAAANENTVGEYRIMVVKESSTSSFGYYASQTIGMANYTVVNPTGAATYSQALANTATDVDGDLIVENLAYRVYVLSVADGVNAGMDFLVSSTTPITLTSPVIADGVSNITAFDIDDNGNGSDLQLGFTAAPNESTVGEYRVMVVKDATASTFDLSSAQTVGTNDYTSITPSGMTNYMQILTNSSTDVDGDAIMENIAYRLFVLSIADGTNATVDSLVSASNTVTLTSPVTADGASLIMATDIDNNGDGSDLQVDFGAANNESTVGEYRILVVKEVSTASFTLSVAQTIGMSNYTVVSPAGLSNYSQTLTSSTTDIDGDPIIENTAYRLFVLSIADGTNATLDSLVSANNPVTLTAPVTADGVTSLFALDIADQGNGADVQVNFGAANNESTVGEYRVLMVKETASTTFGVPDAQAVNPMDYTAVNPTGASSYSMALNSTSTDVDGDLISMGQDYRLFVLSVADGSNATLDSLVMADSSFSLVVSVEEVFRSNAKVFSTGNADIIVELNGDIREEIAIEVFNIKGQMIHREVTQDNRVILTKNLSKNQVYLVALSNKNGIRTTFKVKL